MSEQSALQDLLVYSVKGVGYWVDMARCVGAKDNEIDTFMMDALAAVDKADAAALSALAVKSVEMKQKARELFVKKNGREFSGFIPGAAKPVDIPEDQAAQVALGEEVGKDRVRPDIAKARQAILDDLKKVAASGSKTDAVCAVVAQGLGSLINDKMDKDEYEAYAKQLASVK